MAFLVSVLLDVYEFYLVSLTVLGDCSFLRAREYVIEALVKYRDEAVLANRPIPTPLDKGSHDLNVFFDMISGNCNKEPGEYHFTTNAESPYF